MISVLSCFHPLLAWPTGRLTVAGKKEYKITGYPKKPMFAPTDDVLVKHPEFGILNSVPEYGFLPPGVDGYAGKPVEIPCGQCIGCRIQRSRQWADRCLMELTQHPEGGYFVTLTYNDMHLPWSWYSDPFTGEAQASLTLDRRDVQLFLKRLRKSTGQDLRYFGCGEYGPTTFRPHYHLIIFGLVLDDLEPLPGRSRQGYTYYRSKTVEDAWSFHMRDSLRNNVSPVVKDSRGREKRPVSTAGFCVVGPITWETCAYTARYVTKKLTGDFSSYYDFFNITPPFSMMSLKPGIGSGFYDPDLYKHEFIYLSTEKGGHKCRPPRYFDQKYDIEYPEEMALVKRHRARAAQLQKQLKLEKTDLDYMSLLAAEEVSFQARINSLQRDLV